MRPITALGLFTVLPMPVRDITRPAASGAMAAFPFVGLVIGLFAGVVAWAGASIGAGWLGAAGALAMLALVTGGLHLDGIADTADGLGSRKPRDEALEIMKRSDIGPMGVATIVLVVLLQFAAIMSIVEASSPLAGAAAITLAPAFGRTAVLFASRGPTARPGGFGALMAGTPAVGWVVGNTVAMLVLATAAGWLLGGAPLAVAWATASVGAQAIGWAWQRRLIRHFGGTTGDIYGSIIEVTQTACLVTFAVAAHLLV